MVPPTMAPVLGECPSLGGASASLSADGTDGLRRLACPGFDLAAEVVEGSAPMTTGVASVVGVAVRASVTRLTSRGSRPGAVEATLEARCEAEPQPY